jgi:hypothetical protein
VTALAFKAFVVLFGGALALGLLRSEKVAGLADPAFARLVLILHAGFLSLLFVGVYGLAGHAVTSDVPGYYVPAARAAAAGLLTYRDFPTSYAPLFPYVSAALLQVWPSTLVFPAFAGLCSVLTLRSWTSIACAPRTREPGRRAALLYATNGHVAVQCLLGTNQIWVALSLSISALLVLRGRAFGSGIVQALAFAATKLLAVLFWPLLAASARRPVSWIFGALGPAALIYGAFTLAGADVSYPLKTEGALVSSGNLPYLLEPLLRAAGLEMSPFIDVGTALCLAVTSAALVWRLYRARRSDPIEVDARALGCALALVNVILLITSKKSSTGYLMFAFFPALWVLAGAARSVGESEARVLRLVGQATAFTLLLALEPSLWFLLRGNGSTLSAWMDRTPSTVVPLVLLDIALLAVYFWIAWAAVMGLRQWARRDSTRDDIARA